MGRQSVQGAARLESDHVLLREQSWNEDGKCRALAGHAAHMHVTTELFYVALDDVEANSASGDLVCVLMRRESGLEKVAVLRLVVISRPPVAASGTAPDPSTVICHTDDH